MNLENNPRRFSQSKLLWLGLLALVVMSAMAIYAVLATQLSPRGTIPQEFVGTWRSVRTSDPHGLGETIWDLRDDGTARWRLSTGKTLGSAANTMGYFEWWTEGDNKLVTHQYSSQSAARRARLISAVLGPQGGRGEFEFEKMSENEFKLRAKGGQEATYRRTQDPMIEAAP